MPVEDPILRRRGLAALTVYAVCLAGFAYACATPERGVSIPWSVFFAPLSGVGRLVGWDRSGSVVIAMFFGVAIQWPGLWFVLRASPVARRKQAGAAALIVHYVSAAILAVTSPAYEHALISRPPLVYWACLGAIVYGAGQIVLWKEILRPVKPGSETGEAKVGE